MTLSGVPSFAHNKSNLSKKKILLIIACVLGIIAPFTLSITGIIALILFFICYRDVYGNLQTDKTKPALTVPCPFCNREIPIDSKSCNYCGKVFKIDPEYEKLDFL